MQCSPLRSCCRLRPSWPIRPRRWRQIWGGGVECTVTVIHRNPSDANGLPEASEVMTDIPVTARVERVHRHVGALASEDRDRVQEALAVVLGFAR